MLKRLGEDMGPELGLQIFNLVPSDVDIIQYSENGRIKTEDIVFHQGKFYFFDLGRNLIVHDLFTHHMSTRFEPRRGVSDTSVSISQCRRNNTDDFGFRRKAINADQAAGQTFLNAVFGKKQEGHSSGGSSP